MKRYRGVSAAGVVLACATFLDTQVAAQVLRIGEMNTRQIQALDLSRTVVLVPGGILEEHGPYLPSYTDGYADDAYTRELAKAIVARPGWTVVLFPQIPLGNDPANTIGGKTVFPGSYPVRMATLRAIYMDLATELGDQGFRWIFLVHNHGAPNNHKALNQASDYFHDVYGGTMVHLFGLKPVFLCCGTREKTLSAKELAEDGFDFSGGTRLTEGDVDGGKNSASEREEMSGEDDAIFGQAGVLENFGRVAMREEVIGLEIFVDLDEVEVATGIFACAAGAGLAVADDAGAAGDEAGFGEGAQGENDAGGVAAGIGDEARRGDLGGV